MGDGRLIIGQERFGLTVERLCHQLIEEYDDFSRTCLVGIQPRGVLLAKRIRQRLSEILDAPPLDFGMLDITFYRDDFRKRDKPLRASATEMDFLVEDRQVVLVDDVLYTGRTINAALTALNHYGRPRSVELLVLVDRRFNRHLPVQPDFTGITIDALDKAYVKVEWADIDGEDRVMLFPSKEEAVTGKRNKST